jgi:hypothetical protein
MVPYPMVSSRSSRLPSPKPGSPPVCVLVLRFLPSGCHPERREESAYLLRVTLPAPVHPPPITKPFRIRTYEKCAPNPFRIRTSETQDLKPFRIRTYGKTPGGYLGSPLATHHSPFPRRQREETGRTLARQYTCQLSNQLSGPVCSLGRCLNGRNS